MYVYIYIMWNSLAAAVGGIPSQMRFVTDVFRMGFAINYEQKARICSALDSDVSKLVLEVRTKGGETNQMIPLMHKNV